MKFTFLKHKNSCLTLTPTSLKSHLQYEYNQINETFTLKEGDKKHIKLINEEKNYEKSQINIFLNLKYYS